MCTDLVLIRHGETPHTMEGRYSGHSDPPLAERGRLQAERLARVLSDCPLSALYSSDLVRARETARLVAADRGLEVAVRSALREQYFGRWEGWTYEEIVAEEKDAFDRWMGDIWQVRPPEGECFQEMYRRVVEEIQRIVASCSGFTVGVVAHTGAIAAMVMETLGMPPARMWNLRVSPASISILRCYGNRWILDRFNDVCHLRGI